MCSSACSPGAYTGGRCEVHAGIADRGRNPRQRARRVLDIDDQVDCHVPLGLSLPASGSSDWARRQGAVVRFTMGW